jgi:SNF2 family DNA or RNA helicase
VTGRRTYGRYGFTRTPPDEAGVTLRRAGGQGYWVLSCEPAVSMRAKRTFGRHAVNRKGHIFFAHTNETARDLEWFMDRYPLQPVNQSSEKRLREAAEKHRRQEEIVHAILSGEHESTLTFDPTEKPRDYQLEALELLRATGSLLLTDEVGLGKTFTGSLNFLHEDALPALVVAPAHLASPKGRWVEELDTHFPFLNYHVLKTGTPYSLAGKNGNPDVIISTYGKLPGWADHLAGNIKYVVFDEIQDLRRGNETAKGIASARVADGATYKMGLTATPVYNYAGEAWNIEDVLAPGALGTREEFGREWGTSAGNGHIKVHDPYALGSYLREQGLMLGRTRKDVGRELPKTIKVEQSVDSDPAALDAVTGSAAAMARLILDQQANRFERFRSSGELQMLMRQATGVAKAPYVAEFCRLLLESEEKIVLFGWHRAVYDIWLERLNAYEPRLYTGTESPTQKARSLHDFKNGGSRVLVMSLRSGSGVDGLQKHARVGVFGELDWSPQVHEQGIGRLRRDGMGSDPPVAYFLVSNEGSDPAIAEVLQVKRQQGEQLVSRDGKLFDNSTVDLNRGKLLAEAALARAERMQKENVHGRR